MAFLLEVVHQVPFDSITDEIADKATQRVCARYPSFTQFQMTSDELARLWEDWAPAWSPCMHAIFAVGSDEQ